MKISGIRRKGALIYLSTLALICLVLPSSLLNAAEESGGGGVTVIPDGSFLIQMINFLFLIWVLNILLYRPIRKILAQRKEKIDGLELSIETSNKDAQEKDQAFMAGLKEARAKGFKEKEVLMQQATDEENEIIADINTKAQAELAEFRDKIKAEADVARQNLQKHGAEANLQQADVQYLPYPAKTFDTVINTMAFTGYPDGITALNEIYRVIKPNGRFVLVDIDYPRDNNWLGTQATRIWAGLGDIIRDMEILFRRTGFKFTNEEIGGFGSVHLYIATKENTNSLD